MKLLLACSALVLAALDLSAAVVSGGTTTGTTGTTTGTTTTPTVVPPKPAGSSCQKPAAPVSSSSCKKPQFAPLKPAAPKTCSKK